MGETYPRNAEFVFVSNVDVLDRNLKVIYNLGDK
jgi:hypothetical protein